MIRTLGLVLLLLPAPARASRFTAKLNERVAGISFRSPGAPSVAQLDGALTRFDLLEAASGRQELSADLKDVAAAVEARVDALAQTGASPEELVDLRILTDFLPSKKAKAAHAKISKAWVRIAQARINRAASAAERWKTQEDDGAVEAAASPADAARFRALAALSKSAAEPGASETRIAKEVPAASPEAALAAQQGARPAAAKKKGVLRSRLDSLRRLAKLFRAGAQERAEDRAAMALGPGEGAPKTIAAAARRYGLRFVSAGDKKDLRVRRVSFTRAWEHISSGANGWGWEKVYLYPKTSSDHTFLGILGVLPSLAVGGAAQLFAIASEVDPFVALIGVGATAIFGVLAALFFMLTHFMEGYIESLIFRRGAAAVRAPSSFRPNVSMLALIQEFEAMTGYDVVFTDVPHLMARVDKATKENKGRVYMSIGWVNEGSSVTEP